MYSDRFGEESRHLASLLIIGWQVAEEACPIYFLNQNPSGDASSAMWGEQLSWRVLNKNDPTWGALFPVHGWWFSH